MQSGLNGFLNSVWLCCVIFLTLRVLKSTWILFNSDHTAHLREVSWITPRFYLVRVGYWSLLGGQREPLVFVTSKIRWISPFLHFIILNLLHSFDTISSDMYSGCYGIYKIHTQCIHRDVCFVCDYGEACRPPLIYFLKGERHIMGLDVITVLGGLSLPRRWRTDSSTTHTHWISFVPFHTFIYIPFVQML